ncbi:hypothetical protein [Pseudonocardia oceani]|uniref:hypothetical protein n=1 Tax=Pseudonocardia oceani TaxID=2792013 RepID=UPI001C4A2C70|nr:hypothetical protein [Pseudonocardia oceani]
MVATALVVSASAAVLIDDDVFVGVAAVAPAAQPLSVSTPTSSVDTSHEDFVRVFMT